MQTFACETSWVRISAAPVSQTWLKDGSTGGLSGCFEYAVRPVWLDGSEGPATKTVSVQTYDHCCDGATSCFDGGSDITSSRGQGGPSGAPATPTNVTVAEYTDVQMHPNQPGQLPKSVRLTWDANDESDLAGYHVERAGSSYGPWQRISGNKIAWWETMYEIRGAAAPLDETGTVYSGSLECAHYRLIAVDEEGNESAPAYPPGYPLPNCGTGPTHPAPTGLQVAYSGTFPSCNVVIEWDEVPNSDAATTEYLIYRYSFDTDHNFYFYRTHVQSAGVECDADECCDGEVCFYREKGDVGRSADPELHCPHDGAISNQGHCSTGNLEAFYVTARDETGGESPRSTVVFAVCESEYAWRGPHFEGLVVASRDGGRIRDRTPEVREVAHDQADDLGADGGQVAEDRFSGSVAFDARGSFRTVRLGDVPSPSAAKVGSVRAAVVQPGEREDFQPAVSPLLTLGQASGDPPYEIFDLHVDHLGSTRAMTDDAGTLVSEHKFLPFGEEISPIADETTKRFTGHERDGSHRTLT